MTDSHLQKAANANAAFRGICLSLTTAIVWQVTRTYRKDGIFPVDPLWPGLLVSAITLY